MDGSSESISYKPVKLLRKLCLNFTEILVLMGGIKGRGPILIGNSYYHNRLDVKYLTNLMPYS